MPAKISKEVRQRIYELNKENHPVREILSEGVKISDKSIYNIIKENAKNQSFVSIEVDDEGTLNASFNESFREDVESFGGNDNILPTLAREENKTHEGKDNIVVTQEDNTTKEKTYQQEDNTNIQDKETLSLISIINQGVREGTEQFLSMINKGKQKDETSLISKSNDKENKDCLDEIIKETKKKTSKGLNIPLPVNRLPQINALNTDGMTESEKRLRRDMIIKIRTILTASLTMKSYNQCVGIQYYLNRNSMRRILQVSK